MNFSFQLDTAYENVTKEMHKLDHRGDAAYDEVRDMFDEVLKAVEKRREEVLLDVKKKKDDKKKVLEEQLKIIASEKVEVDSDVQKMKHQVVEIFVKVSILTEICCYRWR